MSAVIEFGFSSKTVQAGLKAMTSNIKATNQEVAAAQDKLKRALENPWATAGTNAAAYVKQLIEAERWTKKLAENHAKLASYTGPQKAATNPWATAGAGQWKDIQKANEALAEQARRIQQRNAALDSFQGRGGEWADTNRILYMQGQRQMAARGAGANAASRNFALGGAALQVQDIAVQLQAGTKLSTVIAQQGSQMLSMFGPSGAILGGVVAVGGALAMMADQSKQAFASMLKDAEGYRRDFAKAMTGSVEDIIAFQQVSIDGVQNAYEEVMNLNQGLSGLTAWLAEKAGGESVQNRQDRANQLALLKMQGAALAEQRALEASAQQVEILRLRAAGENELADAKEKQLQLDREIQRISDSSLSDQAKGQLIADAMQRSAMGSPFDQKKAAQEIAAINARMDAQRIAALPAHERYFELADQQQKVFARMDQEGGAFFEKSIDGVKEWITWLQKAGKTKELLNVTKLLEEVLDLQKQMDEANAAAKASAAQDQAAIDRDLAAKQKARVDEFIATSQASGTMAQVAQGQAANALPISQRPRSAIYHTGRKIGMGGGLNQFYRDQQTASQWQMLQSSPSQWQQLQNGGSAFWTTQRGGSHLDAGLAGNRRVSTLAATASHLSSGLAARRAVERQSATPSDPTSILAELLKVTQKGLLGE